MKSPSHNEGFFAARDNLRLFWQATLPDAPAAHVGIIHGYGEHSGRYQPLANHLAAQGIAAWAFDYRGHGQADGRRGHGDAFSEYLDDLERFAGRLFAAAEGKPVFLLGHSLGGLILARWLLEPGTARGLAGAIFASPYLALARKPARARVAMGRVVEKVVPWLPLDNGIRPPMLTSDPEMQRAAERDPLFAHIVTPRWFRVSRQAQQEVLARAGEIRLPAQVLVPEADPVAHAGVNVEFFTALGSADKELRRYAGALHEPFNEIPAILERALADVSAWILARSR